jgi:DNA repair protein RecN (Recombination protein N)
LQEVEDRLAELERLKRKYGPTLDEVTARRGLLAREMELLTGAGERADDLQKALTAASERFLADARELSRRRRQAAQPFARRIEALLADLAMVRTRFEVKFNTAELSPDEWTDRGIDRGEFFVSPNPGEDLRPLARIVSGGELSRIMLALKTMAAGSDPGRTLIFDEVDAGIGGRVADVVGMRLAGLGDRFQVLCITHLPQIAAQATAHFEIEKQVRMGRTVTSVKRLSTGARVEEIARMIGGSAVSDSTRAAARALLGAKAKGESESGERRKRKSAGA